MSAWRGASASTATCRRRRDPRRRERGRHGAADAVVGEPAPRRGRPAACGRRWPATPARSHLETASWSAPAACRSAHAAVRGIADRRSTPAMSAASRALNRRRPVAAGRRRGGRPIDPSSRLRLARSLRPSVRDRANLARAARWCWRRSPAWIDRRGRAGRRAEACAAAGTLGTNLICGGRRRCAAPGEPLRPWPVTRCPAAAAVAQLREIAAQARA